MKFLLTHEEAQRTALEVAVYLRNLGMKVRAETPAWGDAPYRTTLVATKSDFTILVEAQGLMSYGGVLREFARWVAARQHHAELYVAVASDTALQAGFLGDMKYDGVGLMVIGDDGDVHVSQKARNAALVVKPDPTLKFGDCRSEVVESVKKFNEVNRKDGLRDMCEIVERETEALARRAVKANWVTMDEAAVKGMDWATQINMLASPKSYTLGKMPVVSQTLKDDLHSFRGARNLVDHKAVNKRAEMKRQKQFAERMVQGPRLVADLLALKRKVK